MKNRIIKIPDNIPEESLREIKILIQLLESKYTGKGDFEVYKGNLKIFPKLPISEVRIRRLNN